MAAIQSAAVRLLTASQFYARTGLEFAKLVAQKERLAPPALDQWSAARKELQSAFQAFRSKPVADFTPMQVGRGLLLGVEVLGFFAVGEMIGRGKIVGYAY